MVPGRVKLPCVSLELPERASVGTPFCTIKTL